MIRGCDSTRPGSLFRIGLLIGADIELTELGLDPCLNIVVS